MRPPHPRLVRPGEKHPLAASGRPLLGVFAVSILAWALLLWAGGCFSPTTSAPTLVEEAAPQPIPVVIPRHNPLTLTHVVDLPQGWGSCVAIHRWHDFTVFLTAKHVIESAAGQPFWIRLDMQSPRLPVIRTEVHPDMDIGLLLVQVETPIAQMADEPVVFGDHVFASSWAIGRRLVTDGYVSQWDTCSAEVWPGMSGGGIFRNGLLVGIVEAVGMAGAQLGPFEVRLPVPFVSVFAPISKARPWIESMLPR